MIDTLDILSRTPQGAWGKSPASCIAKNVHDIHRLSRSVKDSFRMGHMSISPDSQSRLLHKLF